MVSLAGAETVIVEASVETGYLLTPAQRRATLLETNPKIRLFMLCNPSNPTGGGYGRAELEGLAKVLIC
jgi:aspartate aminotransferase